MAAFAGQWLVQNGGFEVMNNFRFARSYVGPVRACILDWSGTTADKYVLAPAVSFVDVFKKFNVPISMPESREPMGLRKDLHIKAITKMPSVRARWKEVYGKEPTDKDADEMFKSFVPIQLDVIRQYGTLIPGTKQAIDKIRRDYGCKIGVTTGFLRPMVDILLDEAKKQGYVPDCDVTGDEVQNGVRPKPFMVYRNLDLLNVSPIQSVVKVDDTVSGVGEGLEAGCWTVGVARYSNYMDVDSLEHEAELSEADIQDRLQKTRDILKKSGAHYVIDSIVDLPDILKNINSRLVCGDSP